MSDKAAPLAGRWKAFQRAYTAPPEESLWRSLYIFNLYRLVLGTLFVFLFGIFGNALALAAHHLTLFYNTSFAYAVFALAAQLLVKLRKPRFTIQLSMQVGMDILCVTLLTYASGGIHSGLGILLLVSLAANGLVSRGKITLFFAALASIAILLEHSYAVLTDDAEIAQYVQAGLLSIAYFAVAWVANTLARYAVDSERLARQRGVDLANMAEANRLAIYGMPDGVLVVDGRGAVRQSNPSAERMLGMVPRANMETLLQACSPSLAVLYAAWRRDQALQPQLMRFPSHDYPVRVRFLPVQRQGFGGALVLLEDMKRIQSQAQQIKLAALGRLTANIAHEVRNPLSAISYAAELFQEEPHSPAQARLVQIIRDNAARLNRIVQDVMQLNRRDRAQSEPLGLGEELAKIIAEIGQVEHVHQSVFHLDVDPDCQIAFDRGHFNQVLWNLCGNALRHCRKEPGSLRLQATRMAEGNVTLDVADDGEGVAPTAVHQLFEPFFTTEPSGTGLGLYIARELCEANGATLEYVQPSQGGACFRIVFGGTDGH